MRAPDPDDVRSRVLITAEALARRRAAGEALVIVAIRSDDSTAPRPFETSPRLPGAFDGSLANDFAAPSDPVLGSRPLPSIAPLQDVVRRWGVTPETLVVVYDHDGNLQAARAWWVLRWASLSNVVMLDGGFAAWMRAGLQVDTMVPPDPKPSAVILSAGHMPMLDAEGSAALARRGTLFDSRISPNYVGGPTAPDQAARGHIPGALNVPASDNLDADGRFADVNILRARYRAEHPDSLEPVGIYCGAGVSAAHTVAALATLGIQASMYPGSWSAWSSDPGRAVARGPEPG
ncbi:sulfurtransferase [Lichenicola cladoniae]|uniref:Sulfurtransferase n=1 Tax=Lichenicola cladoniae TaxID=1484109 RepID=A0A6M8HGQ8_9PROT|nr:rhodanese-like domain-containing protein [Lichenicola cladoniae]NPD65237.1 sulfurtransferase [Acetobacteraceae bacterium]QKE88832.1 sulfurtransferase [Lichenicola cladoniae]